MNFFNDYYKELCKQPVFKREIDLTFQQSKHGMRSYKMLADAGYWVELQTYAFGPATLKIRTRF